MGLYDEQNREWSINRRFLGDVKRAKAFVKLGDKIVEKVKGNLDLGANLGHGVKDTFVVDNETTINVEVQPGVTNPMATVTIQSGSVEIPEEKGPPFVPGLPICPHLPHGRPDARMFTQLFGHYVGPTGAAIFEESKLTILDNSARFDAFPDCDDDRQKRPRWNFEREFMYGGQLVKSAWTHNHNVHLAGPDFIYKTGAIPDAPCNLGTGIDVFSDEGLFVGDGLSGGCLQPFGGEKDDLQNVTVITGSVPIAGIDLTTGDATALTRPFVAFNWTYEVVNPTGQSGPPCNCSDGEFGAGEVGELEIVFVYIEDENVAAGSACQMAVGHFFGGSDGRNPWLYKNFLNIPIQGRPPECCADGVINDQWHGPAFCNVLGWADPQFGRFPSAHYAALVGDDGHAMAFIGDKGVRGSQPGSESGEHGVNNGAQSWLNSRNFWWFLDREGFPIDGQGGINDGAAHLVFN